MGWRVLISEKGKGDYTPAVKKFVSRNKKEIGTQVIDWMCRNGFTTPGQLAGEALLRDLDSFKNADGKKQISIKIDLIDKNGSEEEKD